MTVKVTIIKILLSSAARMTQFTGSKDATNSSENTSRSNKDNEPAVRPPGLVRITVPRPMLKADAISKPVICDLPRRLNRTAITTTTSNKLATTITMRLAVEMPRGKANTRSNRRKKKSIELAIRPRRTNSRCIKLASLTDSAGAVKQYHHCTIRTRTTGSCFPKYCCIHSPVVSTSFADDPTGTFPSITERPPRASTSHQKSFAKDTYATINSGVTTYTIIKNAVWRPTVPDFSPNVARCRAQTGQVSLLRKPIPFYGMGFLTSEPWLRYIITK